MGNLYQHCPHCCHHHQLNLAFVVLVIVDDCPGVEGSWMMIDIELAEIGIEVGYLVVDVHPEIEGSWSWTIDVTLVEMEIEVMHGYLAGY